MIVEFPYNLKWRPYQQEVWNEFFGGNKNRFVHVWHRRSGKDFLWFQIMIASALKKKANYLYTLPTNQQARTVIWEGITEDGTRFIDMIPKELLKDDVNNGRSKQQMTIEFRNGSILRIGGADNFDRLVGGNFYGIVHSEYSLQNPLAWTYFSPMLRRNKGWASFIFTFRGKNHAYKLFNSIKNNDDYFSNLLTIRDTSNNDGTPVISEEDVQKERESGLISENKILQEYYCSPDAHSEGAYFLKQLERMRNTNRIYDFQIENKYPVFTAWDLGINDSTAIWFFQYINNAPHAIFYYENRNQSAQHYVNIINEIKGKYNLTYCMHFLPHDGGHREKQTGKTYKDYLFDLGLYPSRVVSRCKSELDAIENARNFMDKLFIHETNCKHGIECISEYHSVFNEKNNILGSKPVHDWSSHGTKALMTYSEHYSSHGNDITHQNFFIENVVNSYSL
ncbi:MAG: hypothetical protein ACTSR1_00220 [Candidatus Heimdallarchaeota archaeon]